mgnify:CR=1 FL=1
MILQCLKLVIVKEVGRRAPDESLIQMIFFAQFRLGKWLNDCSWRPGYQVLGRCYQKQYMKYVCKEVPRQQSLKPNKRMVAAKPSNQWQRLDYTLVIGIKIATFTQHPTWKILYLILTARPHCYHPPHYHYTPYSSIYRLNKQIWVLKYKLENTTNLKDT